MDSYLRHALFAIKKVLTACSRCRQKGTTFHGMLIHDIFLHAVDAHLRHALHAVKSQFCCSDEFFIYKWFGLIQIEPRRRRLFNFEETKAQFYYFQSPILLFPKPKFIILKAQSFSKNIVIFTLTFYINFFLP